MVMVPRRTERVALPVAPGAEVESVAVTITEEYVPCAAVPVLTTPLVMVKPAVMLAASSVYVMVPDWPVVDIVVTVWLPVAALRPVAIAVWVTFKGMLTVKFVLPVKARVESVAVIWKP